MTASERSYYGLAKQTQLGTPNVTDASFSYFLFSEGGLAANNVFLPSDTEVGGGALPADVQKVGVTSAGAFSFIPRATNIGHFLMGALGCSITPGTEGTLGKCHQFNLDSSDQFTAPYYTFRGTPGGMWGESFQDVRVAALSLSWKAADYLRAQVALMGGLPTPNVAMNNWAADAKVDRGASFIAPVSTITWPGKTVKVLGGSINFGANVPLDEQWITGSYSPDAFDINSRMISVSLAIKVVDKTLYDMMSYDPADGAAWTASVLKESDMTFKFASPSLIDTSPALPYYLMVAANGKAVGGSNPNVAWSVSPISLRAGRQVTMACTGTFLQSAVADGEVVTVSLVNKQATQY